MTPTVKIDVEHFRKIGVAFLPSFLAGAVGVKARYDLPSLYYPRTTSDEEIQAYVSKANDNLRKTYRGYGCYRPCPQAEIESGGDHVFVLFTDDGFYANYLGNDLAVGG